jgi:hypothetical protein
MDDVTAFVMFAADESADTVWMNLTIHAGLDGKSAEDEAVAVGAALDARVLVAQD